METKAKVKTKKEVIREFVENSPETDMHIAYDAYAALITEGTASKGLFRTVFVEVKGSPERKSKATTITESSRDTVLELYKEQEKHIRTFYDNKLKATLSDNEEEKKEFRKESERSLDLAMGINHKIRRALIPNGQA